MVLKSILSLTKSAFVLTEELVQNYITILEMFSAWQELSEKFKNGEITKEEYDQWRYNYPSIND